MTMTFAVNRIPIYKRESGSEEQGPKGPASFWK